MALVRALELNSLLNFRNDSATSLGYVSMYVNLGMLIVHNILVLVSLH